MYICTEYQKDTVMRTKLSTLFDFRRCNKMVEADFVHKPHQQVQYLMFGYKVFYYAALDHDSSNAVGIDALGICVYNIPYFNTQPAHDYTAPPIAISPNPPSRIPQHHINRQSLQRPRHSQMTTSLSTLIHSSI